MSEAVQTALRLGRCKPKFDPRRSLKLGRREMYCQLYCFGDEERGIPAFHQRRAYEGAGYQLIGARQNASRLHQQDDIRLRIEWLMSIGRAKTREEAVAAGARLTLVNANMRGDAKTAYAVLQQMIGLQGLKKR
jgi:hypothetical protein